MRDKNVLIKNGVDVHKSLELFGDMEMYDESLGDFLAEIGNKLYKIGHFKEMRDMPNYAILAHSLKSDARYFGFTKLADLSYEHELKSKEKNVVFVNDNYDCLITEANRIVELVKQYLTSTVNTSSPVNVNPVQSVQNNTVEICQTESTNLKSILVVDDSDIIKNFVKKIFISKYHVLTASDGAEAIKMIEQNQTYNIKAILLDLNMPNVDGFKVLEYMKERNLFGIAPVSIITGNDNREIDLNAFQYPIVDIIKKPFSEQAIKHIVEKTIESKKSF